MKLMLLLSAAVALFMCTSFVCAEGGQWYLLTPRMIIRMNVTDTPIVRDIGVRNTDAEPVDIVMDPPASLDGVVFFNEAELNFTLSQGEERRINFTVSPAKAGTYIGDVMVLFTSRNPNVTNAALASEIYVIATGERPANVTGDGGDGAAATGAMIYLPAALAAAGIALAALFIVIILRRR